jgi:hypothetical protein
LLANPELARTITAAIGGGWMTDLSQLSKLRPLESDSALTETTICRLQCVILSRALGEAANRARQRIECRLQNIGDSGIAQTQSIADRRGGCALAVKSAAVRCLEQVGV